MMAYFIDRDTATNTFLMGEISIDLLEPNWEPEEAVKVVPDTTIAKDPQITNDGVNDANVFLEVIVPYAYVVTANYDGTKNAIADTQLFTWTVNAGWTQVGTTTDNNNGTYTYVYAYTGGNSSKMAVLSPGQTTPALFNSVLCANVIEGQSIENTAQDIIVNAYGIQILNDRTDPSVVWQVIVNQTPFANDGKIEYGAGDPDLNVTSGLTLANGVTFTQGDYKYTYSTSYNGWSVSVLDKSKGTYGIILESIDDKPIISLDNTFRGCYSLKEVPIIPATVKYMSATFKDCESLRNAPAIPASVVNMDYTFKGCTLLTGTLTINANPTSNTECLKGIDFTTQNLTLAGKSTILDTLGATGTNYCANCNGVCKE